MDRALNFGASLLGPNPCSPPGSPRAGSEGSKHNLLIASTTLYLYSTATNCFTTAKAPISSVNPPNSLYSIPPALLQVLYQPTHREGHCKLSKQLHYLIFYNFILNLNMKRELIFKFLFWFGLFYFTLLFISLFYLALFYVNLFYFTLFFLHFIFFPYLMLCPCPGLGSWRRSNAIFSPGEKSFFLPGINCLFLFLNCSPPIKLCPAPLRGEQCL